MTDDYTQKRDAPTITRLGIAMEVLRQIEEGECGGRYCWRSAGHALAAIDAAPPEIVLTREEAELCVRALDAVPRRLYQPPLITLRERLYGELRPQKETK